MRRGGLMFYIVLTLVPKENAEINGRTLSAGPEMKVPVPWATEAQNLEELNDEIRSRNVDSRRSFSTAKFASNLFEKSNEVTAATTFITSIVSKPKGASENNYIHESTITANGFTKSTDSANTSTQSITVNEIMTPFSNASLVYRSGSRILSLSDHQKFSTNELVNRAKKELPLNNCYHLHTPRIWCPNGFAELKGSSEKICYILQENQSFPPLCPYPNFLPYNDIKKYLANFRGKTIWLNAFRNSQNGFAHFEWIENGADYGKVVTTALSNPNDIYGKDCVVSIEGNLHRVSCSEQHTSLCVYSVDKLQNLTELLGLCYTSGYSKCILGDFNTAKPTCFCKKTDLSQPKSERYCDKLAEPVFPFQTQLMLDYFKSDYSMCWIGLYKENLPLGRYRWKSSNDSIIYTRWARPEHCEHFEGALKFNGVLSGGWATARDRTLNCAICETSIAFKEPALQLQYDTDTNVLKLYVENYRAISTFHGFDVYCFSDSNTDNFKELLQLQYTNSNLGDSSITIKLGAVADHPSYYWCEAFTYSSQKIVRSNIILANNRLVGYGNDFAILLNVEVPYGVDPFFSEVYLDVLHHLSEQLKDQLEIVQSLRPMRAYFNATVLRMDMLVHLTTKPTPHSATYEYKILSRLLDTISVPYPTIKVASFLSSKVCLPSTTATLDNGALIWPETGRGVTTIPSNRLCLDEKLGMTPVTRKCGGDFLYGAKWEDPVGTCYKDTKYSETTQELFDLINSDASVKDITNDLARITKNSRDKQLIDVHLVSTVLERLVTTPDETVDSNNFSSIISNLMNFNEETLRRAQHLLNSTDKILSSLDDVMNNAESIIITLPRLIVQITEIQTSEVAGMALYEVEPLGDDFETYKAVPLLQNASLDDVMEYENLEAAALLSETILKQAENSARSKEASPKLVIMMFYNDFLFNEQETLNVSQQTRTKIISVSIPGFTGSLRTPVRTVFRMPKNYTNNKNCCHWFYGLDSDMTSILGKWRADGASQKSTHLFEMCEFDHMTHFGLLLQGDPSESSHDRPLQILIAIGSALSLIGVFPVFLTAILFRTWCSRPGNIILINFCVAITAEIILTFSLIAVRENGTPCRVVGACLHYMDLSEFCWMFVIALLQYRRFVLVFQPQEDSIVRKCLFIGWVAPLLPVIVTISASVDNYGINSHGYCYVLGDYLYYACGMPIIIVLFSNLLIFVTIMYTISRQKAVACLKSQHNYKLEILLALFLFFMLGLTWMFGIVGALGGGVGFIYVFCITATLRGVVLFLFFIVGNKEIRQLWKKRLSYYVSEKLQESKAAGYTNTVIVSSD